MAHLGTDLGDFDAVGSLLSGRALLALDISWRFRTPEGSLFTDRGYGYDLRQFLNESVAEAQLGAIAGRCELEALKDDRVVAARATLELEAIDGTKRRLRLVLDLQDGDGPFKLVISVWNDGFTVEVLTQ